MFKIKRNRYINGKVYPDCLKEISHMSNLKGMPSPKEVTAYFVRHIVEEESQQGKGIIHVKDGIPLTAHGALLLGLPWREKVE